MESKANESKTILETIKNWTLPFILIFMGWMFQELKTLEQRQYDMKGDFVTRTMLKETQEQITHHVDVRISDLSNKMEIIISQQDYILRNKSIK